MKSIGVTAIFVEDGLNIKVLHEGLRQYNKDMKEFFS